MKRGDCHGSRSAPLTYNLGGVNKLRYQLKPLAKAFRVVRQAHHERQMANARDSISVRPELVEGQLLPLFIDTALASIRDTCR